VETEPSVMILVLICCTTRVEQPDEEHEIIHDISQDPPGVCQQREK